MLHILAVRLILFKDYNSLPAIEGQGGGGLTSNSATSITGLVCLLKFIDGLILTIFQFSVGIVKYFLTSVGMYIVVYSRK